MNNPEVLVRSGESDSHLVQQPTSRERFIPWSGVGQEAAFAAATGAIATIIGAWALRITPTTLGQRWSTGGDDMVLHYQIFTSGTQVFPYAANPALGFPHTQNLFFAPLFDFWSAIYVRTAGLLGANGIAALNLYAVLSFLAVGITAYLFFRALRLQLVTSVVLGVLFAVSPYHFYQLGIGHPFIANYWAVPLIGILALIVAGGAASPLEPWASAGRTRGTCIARHLVPIGLLALAVALTQSYFYVFGMLVLGGVWLFTALAALVRTRSMRQLGWPTTAIVLLVGFIGVQLMLLSLNWGDRYGQYFATRRAESSEYLAGSLTRLLLPSQLSGIPQFAHIANTYFLRSVTLKNAEAPSSSLIAIGGMVLLMAVLMMRVQTGVAAKTSRFTRVLDDSRVGVMSVGFLWTLLFYVASGLSFVFAYLVSPEIRSWTRISIVIALFAIGFVGILLETLVLSRGWRTAVLAVITVAALVDQVLGIYRNQSLKPVADEEVRQYAAAAMAILPNDCGVVELPLKGFPETGRIGTMGDYDEALPFIYGVPGHRLRWSYGAVRETTAAAPWDNVTTPAEFGEAVAASGACAVQVDLAAYPKGGWQDWVAQIADPDQPTVSSPGSRSRWLLFKVDK